jgi:chromosome partitioning protein
MIIAFAHQKGGVGKSTLCLNVALALAHDLKVAIADLDPQGSLTDISDMFTSVTFVPTPQRLTELKAFPYDLICVDTPPYLSDRLHDLFTVSDVVIIPTRAGVFDALAIRRTVEMVKRAQGEKPNLKAGIVLNMIKSGSTLTVEAEQVLSGYDLPILTTQITDRVAFTRSPLTGGVFGGDDAKAKQQIANLCTEIINLTDGKE